MSPSRYFYRPVDYTSIKRADPKHVEREEAIRLYCHQAGQIWNLQVRGPRRTGAGYAEGKDFIVATAALGRTDLEALRGAIDDLLRDADDFLRDD